MSQFPDNDRGYKTYFDYFKSEYKYTMVEGKKVRTEEKIHLVPEMLKATGLTDAQRNNF